MFKRIKHIHFVGIGGIGMSGIAEVLLNLGYKISGSDQKLSPITERLAALGGAIREGHVADHVVDADVVVTSSAVRADNPEVVEAKRRGIPVIPRAEMLAELMRLKYSIAVAGSHGKTTTTSMVAVVLERGGFDPTIVVGGRLNALGSNARLGRGDFLVAEADESDRSFLKLTPTIAVLTNIDREHMDHYADLGDLKQAFVQFANKVPFYGAAVVCLDDIGVREILPKIERPIISYGTSRQADVVAVKLRLSGLGSAMTVRYRDQVLGDVKIKVPGRHNALNALAAVAVGLDLDMDFAVIASALESFQGADRRFQVKGEVNGIQVVDDYGHHPTEIRATLAAAKSLDDHRLVVVFQPHRYTRTCDLFEEFSHAFYDADLLIVTDIYAAGETPVAGVSAQKLVENIQRYGHKKTMYIEKFDDIVMRLKAEAVANDLIITLGAGDIWKVGERFLKEYTSEV
ncbi:MAG: UDP-N-acetylmuramate--L-alanine ligase [Acidobacteria bacterium]|nr:UDP-N-acetylmuramate--L-alanine ligase [Acidobacteriota bacterium]MBI3657802.1 UDP-N-acetylmuramate--L-alanine ligase [Acidobacteriota bacterium]